MTRVASVSACLLVLLAVAATVCVVKADWLLISDIANAEARCNDMITAACLLVVLALAGSSCLSVCSYS